MSVSERRAPVATLMNSGLYLTKLNRNPHHDLYVLLRITLHEHHLLPGNVFKNVCSCPVIIAAKLVMYNIII